ncbi:hypothetical protein [Paenibacillus tuaregi]|uniref:hypothetical protein n=1 Tax=Paenibacillus tuaregi TaxID=1816681 RepID=UPI000838F0D1|nr:hypothetical protein [Paenibacillus tuaregi]
MWKELAALIGANPILTLVITLLGTSTIWLYKEFKQMIEQSTKTKVAELNEKIKVYSQLQATIYAIIHQANHEQLKMKFIEKFGDYSMYMSDDARKIALDYIKHGDSLYLVSLSSFIEVELEKLNKERCRVLNIGADTEIERYIAKLYAPFKPILLVWSMMLFILVGGLVYLIQPSWYEKTNAIFLIISIFFSSVAIFSIMILTKERSFSYHSTYKWLLNTLFAAAPLLSLITIQLSPFSLIIQISSITLLIRYKKGRASRIFTFD